MTSEAKLTADGLREAVQRWRLCPARPQTTDLADAGDAMAAVLESLASAWPGEDVREAVAQYLAGSAYDDVSIACIKREDFSRAVFIAHGWPEYLGDADAILAIFAPLLAAERATEAKPVAWMHYGRPNGKGYPEKEQLAESQKAAGWTETPLYGSEALAAEREAGRGEGLEAAARVAGQHYETAKNYARTSSPMCFRAEEARAIATAIRALSPAPNHSVDVTNMVTSGPDLVTREEMDAALAREREACAEIAATMHDDPLWDHLHQAAGWYGGTVAAAIRARASREGDAS